MGTHACIAAPHDCHPQSQCHSFQGKENDTGTFGEKKGLKDSLFYFCFTSYGLIMKLTACERPKFSQSLIVFVKHTLCNEE